MPQVDAEDWSLTFDGMVTRPYTITYADLLAMPMVERDVTIMCVSNPIGGDYIGTARWLGTPLMPLLANAGIKSLGNRDFAALCINWLLDRQQSMAIGPRSISEYRLNLTPPQMRLLNGVLLGALPGGVLTLGFLVWARRRG